MSEAQRPIPRLALTRTEAATSLGMSVDSFERYVQPSLRVIRQGRLRLIPLGELEKWVRQNSEPVFEELAS